MTKEQRDLYSGKLHCRKCNYDIPVGKTDPKSIHPDYSITKCKVCKWIEKHAKEIEYAKDQLGLTNDEILQYLHFVYFGNSIYLNDIAKILNKTLEETMQIYMCLHVANKKIRIRFNCEFCGKVDSVPFEAYRNSMYHYCSHECYYKDKPNKISKGENSPFYNRISTCCTNCGKSIKIIPHKNNIKNSFGDNHNFCSKKCYWEFRAKYYNGEKVASYHRVKTEEELEKMRISKLRNMQSDDRLNTSIQIKINNILEKNNILYTREEVLGYYSVDNYLLSFGGIIEVMGDYWHCSPLRYNENGYNINSVQQKQLHKDKTKYSYIYNHYSINILYLWETDINKRPELCEALINKYVRNKGVLDNYHSFNWELSNGILVLKKSLITPYQDLSVNQYRHLIK